jgi:hypothetical protein
MTTDITHQKARKNPSLLLLLMLSSMGAFNSCSDKKPSKPTTDEHDALHAISKQLLALDVNSDDRLTFEELEGSDLYKRADEMFDTGAGKWDENRDGIVQIIEEAALMEGWTLEVLLAAADEALEKCTNPDLKDSLKEIKTSLSTKQQATAHERLEKLDRRAYSQLNSDLKISHGQIDPEAIKKNTELLLEKKRGTASGRTYVTKITADHSKSGGGVYM